MTTTERAVRRATAAAFLALLAGLAGPAPSAAQQAGPCDVEEAASGRAHVVLRCGAGLTLSAERGAVYRVVDQGGDGTADGVRLDRGALLVDAEGARPRRFQILTPTAIASVRGTEYVVDAAADTSSVFVISGAVNVVARGTDAGVVLRSGEGTDVPAGASELRAIRWGQGRVDALLARVGRQ